MARNKIAMRYGVRARNVTTETRKHLRQVEIVLKEAYKSALKEDVYDRTPRPVTKNLLNSVRAKRHTSYLSPGVEVGHDLQKARYAPIRRRMTGIGHYKGQTWNKATEWDRKAVRRARPVIGMLTRGMHRRILGSTGTKS